jgi:transposase
MVMGRILTQGSRRHLKFWKERQAIETVLGISGFDENDLYKALDWAEAAQQRIEKKLFRARYEGKKVSFFLYDITSSYLEGQYNELAAYGYNRDGKRGKKQIVIGLMTDQEGAPIAVEVFTGNTGDSSTVVSQVKKLANRFDAEDVVFVGDRGMIKTAGIEDNGVRYVLRRNPIRASEIEKNRLEKIALIEKKVKTANGYLGDHPKASPDVALKHFQADIAKLKLASVFSATRDERTLSIVCDEAALLDLVRLDGCYVIKTNVPKQDLAAKAVHDTYKTLAKVEWAFRSMKTGFLEIRPLFHRKANRTRACAFVAMLAYLILHHIWKKTAHLNIPLEHIITALDQIQLHSLRLGHHEIPMLPTTLREDQQQILDALTIALPKLLPASRERCTQ